MTMRRLEVPVSALALGLHMTLAAACTRDPPPEDGTTTTGASSTSTTTGASTTSTGPDPADSSSGTTGGSSSTDTGELAPCEAEGTCEQVDVLFVIDNSGSMGEEQLNLARGLPQLVDALMQLRDAEGRPLEPDVNLMVTTTDMGHPLCTAFQKPDYTPSEGAPVYTGCNARINRFTGIEAFDPVVFEEACTENCPVDVAPSDPFIHFDVTGTNVPGDDVGAALACIGPQGIDGCDYESPLETMIRAIDEMACWNDPEQASCDEQSEWADVTEGFLRDGAMLAVVMVTDELDCSVLPDGYVFFTDFFDPEYWNVNPDLGIPQATSAICFNAGVSCDDIDGDGIYEGCVSQQNEVLQPVTRYTSYFEYLEQERGKEVVMLSLVGVPEVVSHEPEPPHTPIAGGVADLVYRNWIDGPYPMGDISPDEWDMGVTAAHKIFEFGDLGPGCVAHDGEGEFTAQALPPVRIREVCESLDRTAPGSGEPVVRCCIESVCDDDFGPAFQCLTGMVSQALERSP